MRRIAEWTVVGAMVGTVAVAGCSSGQSPVCDSLDAVQQSVAQLRNANVSENGLSQVRTDLSQLDAALQQLGTEAKSQFAPQLGAVKSSASQLSTSVATAKEAPNATNLAAVGGTLRAVQGSVQELGNAMSGAC
jgi:hypothetical protein